MGDSTSTKPLPQTQTRTWVLNEDGTRMEQDQGEEEEEDDDEQIVSPTTLLRRILTPPAPTPGIEEVPPAEVFSVCKKVPVCLCVCPHIWDAI